MSDLVHFQDRNDLIGYILFLLWLLLGHLVPLLLLIHHVILLVQWYLLRLSLIRLNELRLHSLLLIRVN